MLYLVMRLYADRDFVLIVLGDHQPAAIVSSAGAPWDVPVHIIMNSANRREVVDRLVAHGFRSGLTPARPSLGHMHTLMPPVLSAFRAADAPLSAALK